MSDIDLERLLMYSSLLSSSEKLQIPDALTLDHEELRAELVRATTEGGRIGKAAARVARLYHAHFAKEEEIVFRIFGMLQDLATDRVRPDMPAAARLLAQFNAEREHLHNQHQSMHAALDDLLQEARKAKNMEIVGLVYNLKNHEKIEDKEIYPTVLQVAGAVQEVARL